jgi:hypothetical protein
MHHPVFLFKHNVSETGFYLLLQVKPTQLGPIDRVNPYLMTSSFQTTELVPIYELRDRD